MKEKALKTKTSEKESFVSAGMPCNPYLPGKEHMPDGEPHIFGDRLYVFGSHDEKRQIPMNYWGNNHGSILELGGEYYIFYHRNTNHNAFSRQGCLEKLQRSEDGLFSQAEITSLGFSKEPFPSRKKIPAYTACLLQRKDMPAFIPYTFFEYSEKDPYIKDDENVSVPYIANLCDGAMAGFRYVHFDGKETEVCAVVRSQKPGQLLLRIDGEAAGMIPLEASDDWMPVVGSCRVRKEGAAQVELITGEDTAVDFCAVWFM